jgi:hypothetical protein
MIAEQKQTLNSLNQLWKMSVLSINQMLNKSRQIRENEHTSHNSNKQISIAI